jgi:hypothetical protein
MAAWVFFLFPTCAAKRGLEGHSTLLPENVTTASFEVFAGGDLGSFSLGSAASAVTGKVNCTPSPKVLILKPDLEVYKGQCVTRSRFYHQFVDELRKFETSDPSEADYVIVDVDTVYQILWPHAHDQSKHGENMVMGCFGHRWGDHETAANIYLDTVKRHLEQHPNMKHQFVVPPLSLIPPHHDTPA